MYYYNLQDNKFANVGKLIAMSLSQDGSGFPFFSPCLYQYLSGKELCNIKVIPDEVPDFEARDLLYKVRRCTH